MEPGQTHETNLSEKHAGVLNTVTPFSKYLAMALFVALPFIGGYVGYKYAPEKVVEVEKVVEIEKVVEDSTDESVTHHYKNESLGFSVKYPANWRVDSFQSGVQFFNYPESEGMFASRWPEGANKVEGGGGIAVSLDEIDNLSDYTLVDQNGLKFYRLDPNATNENRWISIFIPYPENENRVLRFAVYGDADTREQMLTLFTSGFSFEQNEELNNKFSLPINNSILEAAESLMDIKQRESIELNDDYWAANSAEQPEAKHLSPDGLKVYIPFLCNCGGFSTAGIMADLSSGEPEYYVINGVELEWLSATEYRYKKMVSDLSVCEGAEGMCIAQRLSEEWYEGTTE